MEHSWINLNQRQVSSSLIQGHEETELEDASSGVESYPSSSHSTPSIRSELSSSKSLEDSGTTDENLRASFGTILERNQAETSTSESIVPLVRVDQACSHSQGALAQTKAKPPQHAESGERRKPHARQNRKRRVHKDHGRSRTSGWQSNHFQILSLSWFSHGFAFALGLCTGVIANWLMIQWRHHRIRL